MPWSDERPWTQASLRIWSRGLDFSFSRVWSRVIWSLRSGLGSGGVNLGSLCKSVYTQALVSSCSLTPGSLSASQNGNNPLGSFMPQPYAAIS